MIRKIFLVVGVAALLGILVADCTQAPPIPHRSEGLEAVDCLACHELGLKGAPRIHESHLDDGGNVRYDNCDCHEPAPAEEQTPWNEATGPREVGEVAWLVLAPIGLAVIGVLIAAGQQ